MTLHHGDCLDVMAGMDPESVDAIVTDPPYGIGFMGKAWDALSTGLVEASWNARGRNKDVDVSPKEGGGDWGRSGVSYAPPNPRCGNCGRTINGRDTVKGFKVCHCEDPTYAPTANRSAQRSQSWHQQWAEAAYRVAKPSAYLLAFGGTRTVHRMTCALEDAGWIIRDLLVWGYASGFPKSRASLKPAWEPIVMARKPGPLRMLAIDECRIGPPLTPEEVARSGRSTNGAVYGDLDPVDWKRDGREPAGRWPANIVLTDPIFDGGIEGVVGGGETAPGVNINGRPVTGYSKGWADERWFDGYGDTGTYSRFFLVPKAARSDREPVLVPDGHDRSKRFSTHPTVKPVDLMRHLVRLVTPTGGTVLDPFLGSGSTALAAEMEGFAWIGIEREREYCDIAEARLNGTQRGLGLGA